MPDHTDPRIDAAHIQRLLAARHARDTYVAECKDGPTWTTGAHARLDGWAASASWSPWVTDGYEIKVTRADFARDQKWPGYRALCHRLWIVCPSGVVRATDLPTGVGLLWATPTRLNPKVKAVNTDPDPARLLSLMAYVLMWRTRVTAERTFDREADIRAQVESAERRGALAAFVSGHIRRAYDAMAARTKAAEGAAASAGVLRAALAKRGIDWASDDWGGHNAKRQIDALYGVLDPNLPRHLDNAADALRGAANIARSVLDKARGAEVDNA